MVRKRRLAKPAVAQLLQQAAELNSLELFELLSGIEALLAIEQQNQEEKEASEIKQELEVDDYGKPVNQRGYIEEKMIKDCGPYRYLRFWSGKKHRSVYLGKADP